MVIGPKPLRPDGSAIYALYMDDESNEFGEGMTQEDSESLRERVQARGEQAVGDLAQALLDNPVFNQALGAAFGARDKAAGAQRVAMGALDLSSATDTERLERRLRLMSERLEAVESELDRVGADLRAIRESSSGSSSA